MVFAVKLPAHNNLANCSFRLGARCRSRALLALCTMPHVVHHAPCTMHHAPSYAGNHQHAVVHSTCVLEHQPNNIKALYRRGACQVRPLPLPAPSTPRTRTHTRTHTRTRTRTRTTTCSCG